MAETKILDLHPGQAKDPTNALRQRRHRRRKAPRTVTPKAKSRQIFEAEKANDIKPTVTVRAPARHAIDVTAYVVAVGLASVAALFSIRGMVTLFPGAPVLIIAMASMMEAGKLVTAGWLAKRWRATVWVWRGVLVVLVAGLALINAAGVYAQLVAAHVGDRGAATSAIETQDATLAARIDVQAHTVADLDRRLGQIDSAIEEAAKRGKTRTALTAIEDQKKARAGLAGERKREASTLAALQAERASVAAAGRAAALEAVPIHYVAAVFGIADSEEAIRWLIALMVLCCDPLAIALTAAASAGRHRGEAPDRPRPGRRPHAAPISRRGAFG